MHISGRARINLLATCVCVNLLEQLFFFRFFFEWCRPRLRDQEFVWTPPPAYMPVHYQLSEKTVTRAAVSSWLLQRTTANNILTMFVYIRTHTDIQSACMQMHCSYLNNALLQVMYMYMYYVCTCNLFHISHTLNTVFHTHHWSLYKSTCTFTLKLHCCI